MSCSDSLNHAENIGFRSITEVKQRRARSVHRWKSAWEYGKQPITTQNMFLAINNLQRFDMS